MEDKNVKENNEDTKLEKFNKKIEECFRLAFEKDRLETFNENWKELKGFKYCTPKNFAAAGFYNYSSKAFRDNVKCFSCQKELSDWEKNDDPWQEHMKRGSKCPFVLFKGKEKTTIQDFLELLFETKNIMIQNYFEEQKQALQEKEKTLLKTISDLEKKKKKMNC